MPDTNTIHMGFEGTLTIANCTAFRNVKLSKTASEVDITTNQDNGYKVYAKGLIDRSITAELDTSGTNASAVMSAVNSRTPVAVSLTIGGVTESFTALIFGGDIGGSMDDAVWVGITARPTRTGTSGTASGTDPAAVASGS